MARLTIIEQYNRFNGSKKKVKTIKYKKQTVEKLKSNLPVPADVILNGEIVKEPAKTWLMPNDQITFVPKVEKDVLRVVLPVAIAIGAFWAAPAIGLSGLSAVAFKVGVIVAGSLLTNAILPPPKPKLPSIGFDTSQNYSWNARTNDTPDNPIPLIYGTIKTHGTIISSYLSNDGEKHYLNMLVALGEGTVARIYDFKINGQPAYQYDNMKIEARNGKLYQSAINGFNTTKKEYVQDIAVNSGTAWTYTTPENDFDALEVDITFPQGLWYANDKGGLDDNSVSYRISYSTNGGASWISVSHSIATQTTTQAVGRWSLGYWDPQVDADSWIEIKAGSTDPSDHNEGDSDYSDPTGANDGWWRWIETTETVTNSTPVDYATATYHDTKSHTITVTIKGVSNKQVKLKVEKLTADRNNSRYGDTMQVGSVREVYYDDFEYPYIALAGIKALATSKLSGSFDFSCKVDGKIVNVFDGNKWTLQFSSNPAWVCWDVLTQPVIDARTWTIVGYRGIDPSRLMGALSAFKSWADFCDETVADGTKRCTFNGIFDSNMNMWDMALRVCDVGRAILLYNGVNITVVVDRPALSVRPLISIANTIKGSFKESFIPATAKIGKISVDFLDKNNDYNRQQIAIQDKDAGDLSHSVSLQPIGITNLNEAKRYALLRLYHNKYTGRTVQVGMDIDSINFQIGDVIDLQNDVPEWGEGGRIVSATSTTITLDKTLTLKSGVVYRIKIRLDDDSIVDKAIVENGGDYSTLTVATAFSTTPQQYNPYAVYITDTGIKPFRIIGIDTDAHQRATISLLEYDDRIYSLVDADVAKDIPAINYSEIEPLPSVTGLTLNELWTTLNDGTIGDEIIIDWDDIQNNIVSGYEVWHRIKDTSGNVVKGWYQDATVTESKYKLQNVLVGYEYEIAILVVNHLGAKQKIQDATKATLTTLGKNAPPSDVTNFTATEKDFNIVMSWDNILDADLSFYEIQDQNNAVIYQGKNNTFKYNMQAAGAYTFKIKAVDTSGNYSTNWTTASITISAPSTVGNLTYAINGEFCDISWDDAIPTSFPIKQYKITYGTNRTLVSYGKITLARIKVDWGGSRTFYITAIDQFGNEGAEASITVNITAPAAITGLNISVIDNFALLKWNSATGMLPIDFYEIRKGATYATATVIAQQKGNFLTDFETQSGDYTFWVVAVDTAGNYGTEVSQTAHINQPPDYVLNKDWIDDNSGTKTNVMIDENSYLLGNVNTTETWADHFVNNGWNTPQDQITAGYPIYIQPALTTGSYSQTFDYGAVLASTKITVNVTSQAIAGSSSYTVTISTKKLATDSWTVFPAGNSVYATDFRYVKVDIAISGTATDLLEISNIEVRLDSKLLNDGGETAVYAADTNGTTIYFNKAFVDVTSITVTPKGTAQLTAVYDFVDVPNPTYFSVYLFDSTGTRVDGTVSWQVKGY